MKNIVLIGMPASGKSTIGVVLAKTLGLLFVDTDLIIQQREKRLLQDIIDTDGLEAFLDNERDAVLSLNAVDSVISTGGSVIFRDEAMTCLKNNGIVIFINVSIDIIKKRLNNIKTRGVVCGKNQTIDDIYNERILLYKKYSDFTLDLGSKNVEEAVFEIISLLNNK